MDTITFRAADLDGYLTKADEEAIASMEALYAEALPAFRALEGLPPGPLRAEAESGLVSIYARIGEGLRRILGAEERIVVYPFATADERHAEASRLVAKLRDSATGRQEFVYYVQRAYELLFSLAYGSGRGRGRSHLLVRTPVSSPEQAYAVHKVPDIEDQVRQAAICVMLRAALLPSMIVAKEMEEYTTSRVLAPFALFRIKRRDGASEAEMEYSLDRERSYFNPEDLDGRDLVFADPMNATGGSLIAVLSFLRGMGVRPHSVVCLNAISALKGALRCVRAEPNLRVYTLWMDPALNSSAYIMPGLGDAGDRINGSDPEDDPRDILRLIADYGSGINGLYRSQIRQIEATVLGRGRRG